VTDRIHTGGCQCGAVRYRVTGPLGNCGVCHCRMCQKASGNFGMILVTAELKHFNWTRGKPSEFASTPVTRRGFCDKCGTPLYMHDQGDHAYELCVGTLDDPDATAPDHAVGIESKRKWFDSLATLPGKTTEQDWEPDALARLVSRQHPDHDTPDEFD
jgi:hypothetical protein